MIDSRTSLGNIVNVAARLSAVATDYPEQVAIVMPGRRVNERRTYRTITFKELDEDSNRIASGLLNHGIPSGSRLVLLVRPSIDFISLVFALFKAGMVTVLIDPGMSRGNFLQCLAACEPAGFIAIPVAHALRVFMGRRFARAKYNVTVGQRWFWRGPTLEQIRQKGSAERILARTAGDDPAAIIFTTGSTGPPKGVLYSHGNFDQQVQELQNFYKIQPGELDLPGFPLFALFNSAMAVTTVIPDMDATRPAQVDPRNVLEAVHDWSVTQAFGSPAMWNTVGRYCEKHGAKLPTLQRVFSAGAPVPPHVLERMQAAIAPTGLIHTPYGATEALPVASIDSATILGETAVRTRDGAGYCVGHRFPGIQWKVIRISDEPIRTMDEVQELALGEIGELIVHGGVVTREYVTRKEANALHKILDGKDLWHRMGDVGYLDDRDRFWFCGRKSHRVQTRDRVMFTIPCEAIFNQHPHIYRSALVGIGPPGQQRPIVFVEPWPEHWPRNTAERERLTHELLDRAAAHPLTRAIKDILIRNALPVDIRHNAKIFREKLAQKVESGKWRVES